MGRRPTIDDAQSVVDNYIKIEQLKNKIPEAFTQGDGYDTIDNANSVVDNLLKKKIITAGACTQGDGYETEH